ncbi:unnamed protein product [Phytophthora fragariaefolia]|uniref:Unnamed protein product n=1 Tax=Phytophthora fragariaefolia TaxID=1490495 RepID=A0A9W6WYU2_9STRA|nr:unnamed protein product [Phytophthora fragariaefolia]
MSGVIHPFSDGGCTNTGDFDYQIVPWNFYLPAFDPLPMVKTVLLSPKYVKLYNRTVSSILPLLKPIIYTGLTLRFAAFVTPANVGRVLAPISVLLHLFGLVTTSAQLRTEYTKLLLRTFDFWFLQTANTVCTVVLSSVLNDLRVMLVVFCWADFTCWLLQETYLRNSHAIVAVALAEWLFYVLLMTVISFELIDEAHHYAIITSYGRTISTKDILVNTIGTMAMLSLRNLYRRYQDVRRRKLRPNAAMPALGYRTKIALSSSKPLVTSTRNIILPQGASDITLAAATKSTFRLTGPVTRPLLQLHLSAGSDRFNPRLTIWPRIGGLAPLSLWKVFAFNLCCATGSTCAALSIFLPHFGIGVEFFAAVGLISTALFNGIYTCCCQVQLYKRVVTSFYFIFLWTQIIVIGLCVLTMFQWRWIPVCGVVSSIMLAHTLLTVDALTPIMKRRLCFSYWMLIHGIILFLLVQTLVVVDVLVLDRLGLQDKELWKFEYLGRQFKLHVVPILVGRVLTVYIWSVRYMYVVLTRQNDNALILLRGEVEFDYENWKKEANLGKR